MEKGFQESISILMADDDEDDCALVEHVLRQYNVRSLRFVHDGQELLDYLFCRGKYQDPASHPRPDVAFVDLNMPRVDGLEAIRTLKSDKYLSALPLIVFTTSEDQNAIFQSYQVGANTVITKPLSYEKLETAMDMVVKYWGSLARLPSRMIPWCRSGS